MSWQGFIPSNNIQHGLLTISFVFRPAVKQMAHRTILCGQRERRRQGQAQREPELILERQRVECHLQASRCPPETRMFLLRLMSEEFSFPIPSSIRRASGRFLANVRKAENIFHWACTYFPKQFVGKILCHRVWRLH